MAEESGQPLAVTAEQLGITFKSQANDQFDYDLGNLCAHDPAPINPEDFNENREAKCLELATTITQSLVAKLFELPSQAVTGGRVAQLPKPTTILPREKPIPKPKPLTKWQKFAQKKGIVKRKRSKLVYDQEADEWRRRHGYKKAGDPNDIQVIEAKAGDKVGDDPFSEMAKAKKERIKKNNKQQADNIKAGLKAGHKSALPVTLKLAAALPEVGKGAPQKRKELKDDIKALSRHSGISTASMGKFDKRLKGEKAGERQAAGKRRKFGSVTDTKGERSSMSSIADKFLRERSDDIIDVRKAIGKFEAAAREERHQAKKEPKQKAGKVPKARGVHKKPGKSAARGKKK